MILFKACEHQRLALACAEENAGADGNLGQEAAQELVKKCESLK